MREIKEILFKLFHFIIDVLLFGYKTIKQIVLPNRYKKGNLLSVLFIIFIGIVERLNNFEHGVFRMAHLLKQKYIKQSLLMASVFLFLLSSVEWTSERNTSYPANNSTVQVSSVSAQEVNASCKPIGILSNNVFIFRKYHCTSNSFYSNFAILVPSVQTWLFTRNIRI
jgi:hypothetical protein